ncbi:MAG TPA: hypothetical protein VJN18_01605 [Polyangiaceae bacterium]|nr:hypothetical protein [Polyangiaceae bacterium]
MSVGRRLRRRQVNIAQDWVGGVFVSESAEPGMCEVMALWLRGDEVLGERSAVTNVLIQLLSSIAHRASGPAPLRLRIADAKVAQLLRRFMPPSTTVVCAPTPELDRFVAARGVPVPGEPTTPLASLDFCALPPLERIAAELFALKPWLFLPVTTVLHLEAPAVGLTNAGVTVTGFDTGEASVQVFLDRTPLETAIARNSASSLGAAPCYALTFDLVPSMTDEEREPLLHAGWWVPEDAPTIRPSARYREQGDDLRALNGNELEALRVAAFALHSLFSENVQGIDVTRTAVIGSWTVTLDTERFAHVDLRWPADPEKGFAVFKPHMTAAVLRHVERLFRRYYG